MYVINRKRVRDREERKKGKFRKKVQGEREKKRKVKDKDRLEKTESKSVRDVGGRLGHKLANLLRCKTFDDPPLKQVQM